jgi:hypothetical protein
MAVQPQRVVQKASVAGLLYKGLGIGERDFRVKILLKNEC